MEIFYKFGLKKFKKLLTKNNIYDIINIESEGKRNMKHRRLKKWVKKTLFVISFITTAFIISEVVIGTSNSFEEQAKQCDETKGYTCSYYEVRNFSK